MGVDRASGIPAGAAVRADPDAGRDVDTGGIADGQVDDPPSGYRRLMPRSRSPQEKELSLTRDRRNNYGGNDKASQRNTPRAKARVNRANRRADLAPLTGTLGAPEEDLDAAVANAVEGRRPKEWRKRPDEPLGSKLARRAGPIDQNPPFDPSRRGR